MHEDALACKQVGRQVGTGQAETKKIKLVIVSIWQNYTYCADVWGVYADTWCADVAQHGWMQWWCVADGSDVDGGDADGERELA